MLLRVGLGRSNPTLFMEREMKKLFVLLLLVVFISSCAGELSTVYWQVKCTEPEVNIVRGYTKGNVPWYIVTDEETGKVYRNLQQNTTCIFIELTGE